LFDIRLVRETCRDIHREQDPHKAKELLVRLRAIMKGDREQFKTRVQRLTRKYTHLLRRRRRPSGRYASGVRMKQDAEDRTFNLKSYRSYGARSLPGQAIP
jgi:hypothetical protein